MEIGKKWAENVTVDDFAQMKPIEREGFIYTRLNIDKESIAEAVAEFEWDKRRRPNAVMISVESLSRLHPVIIREVILDPVVLKVIPMDFPRADMFTVTIVDPWEYESIFFG